MCIKTVCANKYDIYYELRKIKIRNHLNNFMSKTYIQIVTL